MGSREGLTQDLWAGLATALVVVPSSIAFGTLAFAPLGAGAAASGALAGVVGAIAAGILAPLLGGTRRMITGPCAPAAAVVSALAVELARRGTPVDHAVLLIALAALLGAALQFVYGVVGGGRLIKFIPYPVVSGYMTAVGLLILLSQIPKFLGVAPGTTLGAALSSPALWNPRCLLVGVVTIAACQFAGRLTKAVPSLILGLLAGVATYLALGFFDRGMLSVAGNPQLVGPMPSAGLDAFRQLADRWATWRTIEPGELRLAAGAALTFSLLLSIDTLKTCVYMDPTSDVRHDSDKELRGQGVANFAAALGGGMTGSGLLGPTIINIASGARTNLSAIAEGVFCLASFVALRGAIAWIPTAALAGILFIVAYRMADWSVLSLLKQRATYLDFAVAAAVVVGGGAYGLIVASALGLAAAILLFVRQQMRGSIIRRRTDARRYASKQQRLPAERKTLERLGEEIAICQLQGNLFFGTADELYTEVEADMDRRGFVLLDMRRVQSVDATAARVLQLMAARMAKRGAVLVLSGLHARLPGGMSLARYLDQFGLVRGTKLARVFPELDDALCWAENSLLSGDQRSEAAAPPLELSEIDVLRGFDAADLDALRSCLEERTCPEGAAIFKKGDSGDELFFIRRGKVRVVLPHSKTRSHHLATFARGDSFGEVAFLDGGARSADAVADADVALFALSRRRFEAAARKSPPLAVEFFARLARMLALRLRTTNAELTALQED